MAVLKHTSPTAWPAAPKPKPSSTVPSASTSRAVALGSAQPESSCLRVISGLHSRGARERQSPGRNAPSRAQRAPFIGMTERSPVLRDDINNALKVAMKAQDQRRVSTLRLVNAALKNADIEARGQSKGPLTDDELLSLLQKMIKQRQESVELYDKGGRPELAGQEREEIAIITSFLPQQMSEDEIKAAVATV